MKLSKKLLLFGTSALLLAGCGGKDNENEEETSNESETEEVEKVKEEKTDLLEFNDKIVDDEKYTVVLRSIEKIDNEQYDEEKIEIELEIENKTDSKIEVQTKAVTINNHIIDDSFIYLEEVVDANKTQTTILELQDPKGKTELPDLEGNLEMLLYVYEQKDTTFEEEVNINVSLD